MKSEHLFACVVAMVFADFIAAAGEMEAFFLACILV